MRGAVSSGEGGEPGEVSTRASAAARLLHLWGRHLPDLACRQPLAAARSRPSVVTSEARRRTASLLVRLHYVFCGPDRRALARQSVREGHLQPGGDIDERLKLVCG